MVAPMAEASFDRSEPFAVVRVSARSLAERGLVKWTSPRKPAVQVLRIEISGVAGDYNHYRTIAKGSDPDRAVTIVTLDALTALQRQGYNILPGDLGENITLAAPDALMATGTRFSFGTLILELVEPTTPCQNLEHIACVVALSDRQRRAFPRACRRRCWYARVLAEGELRAGDSFELSVDRPSAVNSLSDWTSVTGTTGMAKKTRRWQQIRTEAKDTSPQVLLDNEVLSCFQEARPQASGSCLHSGRKPGRWRIRSQP